MELFDIIKTIFKSDTEWNKVSNSDKIRNYFMINRIMSINFPIQADQFNRNKISPYPVADWWHRTLSKNYNRVPEWIYTKTNKPKKNKPDNKIKLEGFDDIERWICERFQVSKRELNDLKNFYPDKYKDWLTSLEDQLRMTAK